ncbi:MAG: guanylate kinase [Clostridia bacterium]|nr:guanylate kinase [Clostridia bacterium]
MSRRFRMTTALDVDDVLLECIPYAIKLANEKYKFDPPLTIYEVDRWGKLGTRADVIFEFFTEEFFRTQPVIEGAKEFVRKLSQMTEVFVCTSVYPQFMSIRAEVIMREFPEIPPENIYMASRKDKLNVDILFDDGMHNVLKSNAAYPILLRRPWNQSATGMLAVNNYDEFLKLVEVISSSYSAMRDDNKNPSIVALVGPSGSGKSNIAKALLEREQRFEKLLSYTTIDPTANTENDWYNYVDKSEFFKMLDNNELFESTMYAGHGFGSKRSDIDALLGDGKTVLTIMDICGAMSLKTHYKNVVTVYIKRDKRDLLASILEKNSSNEDKVNRIIAIDDERRNEEICDFVVENNGDYDTAAEKIIDLLF